MRQKAVNNVSIRGIQCAVPGSVVPNDHFYSVFNEGEVRKISSMTGVFSRRIIDKDTCTSDLCVAAANKLMQELDWEPSSVEAVFLVTQTPDYRLPATSCIIQDRLGISTECAAFDINLGCSGYVYGLWLASSLVTTGNIKRVLLLVGDTISKMSSPFDRSTTLLFGDAGSATAIEYDADAPVISFVLGTDGSGRDSLLISGGGYRKPSSAETVVRKALPDGSMRAEEDLYMDGGEIFNFTIQRVPPLTKALLEEAGKTANDVNYYILHQANEFIIKHLSKKLGLADSQVPTSLGGYGNTSSASIPLTIAAELEEDLKENCRDVALLGFGVGFSWGGALTRIGPLKSLGVLEV